MRATEPGHGHAARPALVAKRRPRGKQVSDAPGAAFPHPGASGGDATDPAPPDPTNYLARVDDADRPAKRREILERTQPDSDSAPSGGP
jgi:hypothetical protein